MSRIEVPEKGLPVDKEGNYKPLPPWMKVGDAKNGAQLMELAMREHAAARRLRKQKNKKRRF